MSEMERDRKSKLNGRGKRRSHPYTLITGGAGFIGTNVAHQLLSKGESVMVYDNLSRSGVKQNLNWLRKTHGDRLKVEIDDVCNFSALRKAAANASQVFHFAAQVAVTTSLEDPIRDFEVNARGTLNLLECLRTLPTSPPLIFTSTNKVYGDLEDVRMHRHGNRYEPEDSDYRENGFSEKRPLHFHSPYGCSKGAACQYVLDYARTFDLPAVVFRMSCIYGTHQHGNEDQGWIAHFLIQALKKKVITIYGDGRQVRDILFIDDLVEAFFLALKNIDQLSGQAFNMGGGSLYSLSLLELVEIIAELNEQRPKLQFDEWRRADQQYYVSDTRKFSDLTGWHPKVNMHEGISRLYQWLSEELFGKKIIGEVGTVSKA